MGVSIAVALLTFCAKGTSTRWLALLLGPPDQADRPDPVADSPRPPCRSATVATARTRRVVRPHERFNRFGPPGAAIKSEGACRGIPAPRSQVVRVRCHVDGEPHLRPARIKPGGADAMSSSTVPQGMNPQPRPPLSRACLEPRSAVRTWRFDRTAKLRPSVRWLLSVSTIWGWASRRSFGTGLRWRARG
jgi:hypothetical protein